MSGSAKSIKLSRYGLTNSKKKLGVNYWRFYFNGMDAETAVEQGFYVELELLNSWVSPKETVLGYKLRVAINSEDLQYALAGTKSAQDIKTENLVQPSYVAVRVGMLGKKSKQICAYYPVNLVKFYNKPFGLELEGNVFSEDGIAGKVEVTKEALEEHPEFLCDCGSAAWNLSYEISSFAEKGYKSDIQTWIPTGLNTKFSGTINFDGTDYLVDPRKSYGYVDRFWGKELPETWFHLSSSSIQSIISGSQLFNTSFSVYGKSEDKVSFIGNLEGTEIEFIAGKNNKYTCVFDCIQAPEAEDPSENLLHWTVSLNNKNWIVDIDVFCKIKELYNRKLEVPEGNRKVLDLLESQTGTGEIKLYHRKGHTIEQIENATITKAVCQFGHIDSSDK